MQRAQAHLSRPAAAGKPVIAGRSGGVPEAVKEDETGLLVEGTDVDELVAAIRRLAGAEDLRRRLGATGRARVERAFTWEQSARELAAFHARLTAATEADIRRASEDARAHA